MHRKVTDTINIHTAPIEIDIIYSRILFIPVSLINDCNICEYINISFRAGRFNRYCGCRVVSYYYDGMLKLYILLHIYILVL